jgi:hypothetical protein
LATQIAKKAFERKLRRVQGYSDIETLTETLERIEAEDWAAAKRVA